MKIFKYIGYALMVVLLCHSCKKDHSNTSVEALPDFRIDTTGLKTRFETRQSASNVVIDPAVVYSGEAANLEYLWRVYGTTAGGDPANTRIVPLDTIGRSKQLSSAIRFNPGNYTIELQVKDKITGLVTMMRYAVTVVSSRPHGWLVAYETVEGGSTDVSLIRNTEIVNSLTTDTVMYHIYSSSNGTALPGLPLRVIANVSSPTQNMLVTDQTVALLNRPDYQRIANFNQLFIGGAPAPKPEGILEVQFFGNHIVNNGDVYWMYGGVFIGKITVDAKGYKAAPFGVRVYAKNGGFYDTLNKRFIFLEQQVSQGYAYPSLAAGSSARFDLNNIGKDLLFIGDGSETLSNFIVQYAFFKDTDGAKVWFYGINFGTPTAPDLCKIDITNMPGISNAKYFDTGTLGTMALYATDNAVYSFAFDRGAGVTTTPALGFTAPSGELISSMKIFKSATSYVGGAGNSNRLLYVSTWNAVTKVGKVYILSINPTSGLIGAAPLKVFSGFGKIKDMTLKPV